MQARYIPEWSVVTTQDGKIGVLAHKTASRKPLIQFNRTLGREINKNTELEVVKFPAELAGEYVRNKENKTDGNGLSIFIFWEIGDEGLIGIVPASTSEEAKNIVLNEMADTLENKILPEPELYTMKKEGIYFNPYEL